MRVAVVGTGIVGRTLAVGLTGAGHEVVVATRDPQVTRQREEWVGLDARWWSTPGWRSTTPST